MTHYQKYQEFKDSVIKSTNPIIVSDDVMNMSLYINSIYQKLSYESVYDINYCILSEFPYEIIFEYFTDFINDSSEFSLFNLEFSFYLDLIKWGYQNKTNNQVFDLIKNNLDNYGLYCFIPLMDNYQEHINNLLKNNLELKHESLMVGLLLLSKDKLTSYGYQFLNNVNSYKSFDLFDATTTAFHYTLLLLKQMNNATSVFDDIRMKSFWETPEFGDEIEIIKNKLNL